MRRKLLFALLLGVSTPAAADVITFDPLPTGFAPTVMPTYAEDGMTVTSTGGNFWSYPDPGMLHMDPSEFGAGNSAYRFVFAGGPFDLISLDITYIQPYGYLYLLGLGPSGQTLNELYLSGFGTMNVTGFNGISTLVIENRENHISIDNFTFAASGSVGPVPEPGTWASLLLGFGLTGFVLRRSKRLTAKAA